jgi:cell division protein FtsI/penicillin-binding protein 2
MIEHEHFRRYAFLSVLLFVIPALIAVQLIRVRLDPNMAKDFRIIGPLFETEQHLVTPARGQILDRWGNLLAGNRTVYEVSVELKQVKNPQTIALTLKTVLGEDYDEILARASGLKSEGLLNVVLVDNVSQTDIDDLKFVQEQMQAAYGNNNAEGAPSLSGLRFTPHLGRIYPEKTLASNLLGFVGRDSRGYFGIEERYNDLLAGKPKMILVSRDPNRVRENPSVPDGASLVLTLDRAVQQKMEEVIDAAIIETGSSSGTLLVMDPRNGEILALATTPRLDLNEFWQYSDLFSEEAPYNRGISQAYEPGSVFKVLTMASALDDGAVKPETVFVDTGAIEVGGVTIYNWNSGAWGPQDMLGCMQHSLNVCLAWVATQIGANDFYRYLQNFGIGHATGVDMAGEASGRLKIPGDTDWFAADLGTNAFGQGVAATPLQMGTAISAIANHGKMMAPHIVRSVVSEGYQHDIEQRVLGMPVSAETADTLSNLLARSLETESSDALVTGYRVAGKTGTAEIPTPFGYTTNQTNASFVGWGPVDDPRFLVYVWLEKPATSPWGSIVAAPVFRRAVEELVVLINLPPDDVRRQLNGN